MLLQLPLHLQLLLLLLVLLLDLRGQKDFERGMFGNTFVNMERCGSLRSAPMMNPIPT